MWRSFSLRREARHQEAPVLAPAEYAESPSCPPGSLSPAIEARVFSYGMRAQSGEEGVEGIGSDEMEVDRDVELGEDTAHRGVLREELARILRCVFGVSREDISLFAVEMGEHTGLQLADGLREALPAARDDLLHDAMSEVLEGIVIGAQRRRARRGSRWTDMDLRVGIELLGLCRHGPQRATRMPGGCLRLERTLTRVENDRHAHACTPAAQRLRRCGSRPNRDLHDPVTLVSEELVSVLDLREWKRVSDQVAKGKPLCLDHAHETSHPLLTTRA